MEPADLNPASRDDAHLEALLRRPAPLLADDGFSARVLTALPLPESTVSLVAVTRTLRLRDWCWMAGAVIGLAFAALGLIFAPGAQVDVAASFASIARNAGSLMDPVVMCALVLAAGSVRYALKPRSRVSARM